MTSRPGLYLERVVDPATGEIARRQRMNAQGELGWRLRVRDVRTGTQPETTFWGTENQAVRELHDREQQVASRGTKTDRRAKTMTVDEFRTAWLAHYAYIRQPDGRGYAGVLRPYSTYAKAESITRAYIVPRLGERTLLRAVSTGDLTSMIAGTTLRDGVTVASDNTLTTVASVTKSMFRDAKRMGLLPTNIAESIPASWGTVSARRRALVPSIAAIEKLATTLDDVWPLPKWCADLAGPSRHFDPKTGKSVGGEGHGDILRLICYTGMRWEEIAAALASDVHRRASYLSIHDTASESGGRREVRRVSDGQQAGKSVAATRRLAIVTQAWDALDRLEQIRLRGLQLEPAREARRAARAPRKSVAKGAAQGQRAAVRAPNLATERRWQLLVSGEQGGHISYAYWRKQLRKARAVSGIDVTAHEGRHIAAAILIASGANAEEVREQMGHASVATTERVYRHLWRTDKTELAKRIAAKIDLLKAAELDELLADEAAGHDDWPRPRHED